jgi:hypothetical protein
VFITVNVDEIFKEVQIGKRIGPTSELWRFLMSKAKQEENQGRVVSWNASVESISRNRNINHVRYV